MTKPTNLYTGTPDAVAHMRVNANRAAAILAMDMPRFSPGDRVYKDGGNYQAWGRVIGVNWTTQAKELILFEFEGYPGMVHVFSPNQVTKNGPTGGDNAE